MGISKDIQDIKSQINAIIKADELNVNITKETLIEILKNIEKQL